MFDCGMAYKKTKVRNFRLLAFLLIILFVFFHSTSFAQVFGGNPPSLKWSQINTDTIRVIFPLGMEEQAQRVANSTHYLSRHNRRSIGDNEKKLNIVLHNQTMESNGYVGLAPFRSEFFLSPPQSALMIGTNWLDVLTIHEYRHALQFTNARQGITKIVYYLTGDLGWSTMINLSIPDWFLEGDAVVQETALTQQGRGRMPAFYIGYRSLIYSDQLYNYQKARNGSLKDFVPDHYKLGYLMCDYGRQQYGNDFWKGVVADAGRYKGVFYPFSRSVKRKTGLNIKGLYDQAFLHYENVWLKEKNSISSTDTESVNQLSKKNTYTSYRYPAFLSDGQVIANKISYKKIGGYNIIAPNGEESLVRWQGITLDRYFTHRDDKLLWTELGFNPRWGWKNYSNIIVYDIKSGKKKKLCTKQKYLSPDLSYDGSKIIVFKEPADLNYALCVIDAKNGTVLKELPNPDNYYFSYPRWLPDNENLIAVARKVSGKTTIMRISSLTGEMQTLIPWTNHVLGAPYPGRNTVYFSASFSGIDQIYAVRYDSPEIFLVYEGANGAYDVTVDPQEQTIMFSVFTRMGNDLKIMPIDTDSWNSVKIIEPVDMSQYQSVSAEEEGGSIINKIPDKLYPVKKYSQSSRLINLHSWGLLFDDPLYELSVRSNNILNTFDFKVGVRYNRNDKNYTWFGNIEYAQLFPIFYLNTSFVRNSNTFKTTVDDGEGNIDEITVRYRWNETVIQPGVRVPLNLSSGTYFRSMNIYTNYDHRLTSGQNLEVLDNDKYKPNNDLFSNFSRKSMVYGLLFSNSRMQAKQNIYPKFSQFFAIKYTHAIDTFRNAQLFADAEFTFPGLFVNHNFVVQTSWQNERSENNYRYPDGFRYARGYSRPYGYDQIYLIGLNYHMPLWYPDIGLAGIVYFYRLRLNFFFDYSRTMENSSGGIDYRNYNSLGAELIFDTQLLNSFPMSFGVRYSYLLNEDYMDANRKYYLEFFIPVMRF